MRLISFHLSGFKSFAKATTLEFPRAITAIVGPNGSGKSNIAEGVRWALGEQSMKILRGKKGEDLIFNGSPEVPRVGKASVKLIFDNRGGKIPVDFDKVIFERKIFRDGTNEYSLNGSQVRLKDVVELLARMGLGETKHNIIGQGEVDRTLLANPRERREMLEEAIGLRVYQLKKTEAERKLEETSKNIGQAQTILREIAPHLKFLRAQAQKAENRASLEEELQQTILAWIVAARSALDEELKSLEQEHGPEERKLALIEKEIETVKKEISKAETGLGEKQNYLAGEKEIAVLETKRGEFERELGRLEGKLESASKEGRTPVERTIEAAYVRKHLSLLLDRLEEVHAIDDLDEVRERIEALISSIEALLAEVEEQTLSPAANRNGGDENRTLHRAHTKLQEELSSLHKEIERMRKILESEVKTAHSLQEAVRMHERALREKEEERNNLRSSLQRCIFQKERLSERAREIEAEEQRAGVQETELRAFDRAPFSEFSVDELRKKIEKYRIKLEEIGGIDPAVVKEYQDTSARYEFLEKEVADLESASRDLRHLIKELEETMERDFQTGFNKIKDEFNNYFRIIFGGGKGVLKYAPIQERGSGEEDEKEDKEREFGIDIDVDVPRKRIQSLAMLSGGERALTSIALLFAITAVNPPPFLVLDETDAALDEANSQKYAAILKELSKKTQLVLITHNRETMKQAGVLYGITMGGDGVSKLISLKLEEAEVYTNR